jgi:hypothetical protein
MGKNPLGIRESIKIIAVSFYRREKPEGFQGF